MARISGLLIVAILVAACSEAVPGKATRTRPASPQSDSRTPQAQAQAIREEPPPHRTRTRPQPDSTSVGVWFTRHAALVRVERPLREPGVPATTAMEALLAGPTERESAKGISTAIPEGARLLGLEVSAGIATVDLSRGFEPSTGTTGELLTLAQVVYTLTQFPTVDAVRFELNGRTPRFFASHGLMLRGEPQTREDYRWLRKPVT